MNEEYTSSELGEILGHRTEDWSATALTHNAFNAVTSGIWRIESGSFSTILKVISHPADGEKDQWSSSEEPSHWNYWRREVAAYETDLTSVYESAGICGPRLLASYHRPGGETALWLEDVRSGSIPGTEWDMETYGRFAYSLGLAQGRIIVSERMPQHEWLTKRFLRSYVLSKSVDREILHSDEAWRLPPVSDNFPSGLRRDLARLSEKRESFFSYMERLPRTLCHLDVWPMNLFARKSKSFTLLDWSFVGEGALGEDIGNLVPDSVFDLFIPAGRLKDLDEIVYSSYVSGLRDAGWDGDERLVRLGVCASCVKYEWLGPLMLTRASEQRHLSYGGGEVTEVDDLFNERGQALAFLASWAEEARSLAGKLGFTN